MDDDGTGSLRKFAVTSLWSIISALPSLILHALDIPMIESDGDDASRILLPGLWFLCGGLTSPMLVKILGAVPVVKALPPAERRLDHLPSACARLVREAATIRADLDATGLDRFPARPGLDCALQRAWELANEADQVDPDARARLEHAGASLHAVREIVAGRAAGSRVDAEQLRARLIAALADFERALESPRAGSFR
jgi:hypothetical protein